MASLSTQVNLVKHEKEMHYEAPLAAPFGRWLLYRNSVNPSVCPLMKVVNCGLQVFGMLSVIPLATNYLSYRNIEFHIRDAFSDTRHEIICKKL